MNNDIGMDTLQEMKEKENFFEVSAVLQPGKHLPWMFGSISTYLYLVIEQVRSWNWIHLIQVDFLQNSRIF